LGDEDESHLSRATQLGRVLLTRDIDFVTMNSEWARQGRLHAGIIYIQSDRRDNPGYAVNRIMRWQEEFHLSQMSNVVWWI
jgi:hypothetical protein